MTIAHGWRKRRDFDFSTPRCHDLAMELRHLRTIEAVARHGSLTKAGEELYLSQSAISQQIRRLELELGFEVSGARAGASSSPPRGA